MKNHHPIKRLLIGLTAIASCFVGATLLSAGPWNSGRQRALETLNSTTPLNVRVDPDLILEGGPSEDGIPSIDNPDFDTAQNTPFDSEDAVIGLVVNGEAKAYPLNILNWHEIVNDRVGAVNVSITYCPLCHTGVVFKRGQTTFGVSGKLFQSCLVMSDRTDKTLYAQPWGLGIVGDNVNQSLEQLPATTTTLKAWLAQYPNSKILSTRTGHQRDYTRYPYGSYNTDNRIIFPVRHQNQLKYHPKAIISYVWQPNAQTPKNYFSGDHDYFVHDIVRQEGSQARKLNGQTIRARWDSTLSTVIVETEEGEIIPSSTAFAFVYPSFYGIPD